MKKRKKKKKWAVLKETLESERKLVNQALEDCIEAKDYTGASEYDQQRYTVNWVLRAMEVIEETGNALNV